MTKPGDQGLGLSASQYTQAEQLVALLKPFEVTTIIWSGESYATISCVVPMAMELAEHLQDNDDGIAAIARAKSAMRIDLLNRFHLQADTVNSESIAAALDPRFHHLDRFDAERCEAIVDEVRMKLREVSTMATPLPSTANPAANENFDV